MSAGNKSIVILNHHANAPDLGGAGQRHYDIGKYFSERNNYVTVIASSFNSAKNKYTTEDDIYKKVFNENFSFVRLKTKPKYTGTLGRFLNYWDYSKKASKYNDFKKKPDVVIASSVHPFAWIAGYNLSKKYGAKYIVEVRDLWPLSMYEDFTGIKRKIVFSFFESLERKYYRLADAIVTTAPFAYEYIVDKYGIDNDIIHYIPHGIDIEEFDKQNTDESIQIDKNLNNILENYFCITYTGALSRSEGLHALVESARYLKEFQNIKIVIVGAGSEKQLLDDLIKKDDLENVYMAGLQPKDHMAKIMNKSKILFVGLMEREVFKYGISKNKFYEYMAAERPIIFASNVRGSLITQANCGITIEPHNPKLLSDTIKYIHDNYETKGKEYALNGRQFVKDQHTNDIISQKFLNII